MNPITISGFKAYDLRGRIPNELNEDVAYRVGRAYAEFVKPKKVIVGRDIRLSSDELCGALTQGLLDSGVVTDWREPDVIRVAPVPLYNSFEDCWRFVELTAGLSR